MLTGNFGQEQSYMPTEKGKIHHQRPHHLHPVKMICHLAGESDSPHLPTSYSGHMTLWLDYSTGKNCRSEKNEVEWGKAGIHTHTSPPHPFTSPTPPHSPLPWNMTLWRLLWPPCSKGSPCSLPIDEVAHQRLQSTEGRPWSVSINFTQHKAQTISV